MTQKVKTKKIQPWWLGSLGHSAILPIAYKWWIESQVSSDIPSTIFSKLMVIYQNLQNTLLVIPSRLSLCLFGSGGRGEGPFYIIVKILV